MDLIRPDWPAPARVQACFTSRVGGDGSGQRVNVATVHRSDRVSSTRRDNRGGETHNRNLLADDNRATVRREKNSRNETAGRIDAVVV